MKYPSRHDRAAFAESLRRFREVLAAEAQAARFGGFDEAALDLEIGVDAADDLAESLNRLDSHKAERRRLGLVPTETARQFPNARV